MKTAAGTGGSRGIGRAIVKDWFMEGCQVAFSYPRAGGGRPRTGP